MGRDIVKLPSLTSLDRFFDLFRPYESAMGLIDGITEGFLVYFSGLLNILTRWLKSLKASAGALPSGSMLYS